MPSAAPSASACPPPRGPAPRLGQHNQEVLQGLLGVDDKDYQRLLDEHVIGDSYLEDATSA